MESKTKFSIVHNGDQKWSLVTIESIHSTIERNQLDI